MFLKKVIIISVVLGIAAFCIAQGGEEKDAVKIKSTVEIAKLKSVKLAGIQIVREADRNEKILPFRQEKGLRLALVAELDEGVKEVIRAKFKKILTDTGQDFLSNEELKKLAQMPRLSKDKTKVVFETRSLELPDDKAKIIKEISGFLEYTTAGEAGEIDFGIMDFSKGGKSKDGAISVDRVVESIRRKNTMEIWLKPNVEFLKGSIRGVKFYNASGQELRVKSGGSSWVEDKLYRIGFSTRGSFPSRGRIVFEVFGDMKKHRAEFKLEKISLDGKEL